MKYDKDNFIEALEIIKKNLSSSIDISEIRALESNPATQVVEFKSRSNKKTGIIVVGENNDKIVVDVIVDDEKDSSKGTPAIQMEKINIKLLDDLSEWLKKYCD